MRGNSRNVYYSLFMLLMAFTLFLPVAFYIDTPHPVQAAETGRWELINPQVSGNDSLGLRNNLGAMKITIDSGEVNANHTQPFNHEGSSSEEGGKIHIQPGYKGQMTFTMNGTYSSSSGMSGTYSMIFDGSLIFNDGQFPYVMRHSGTFTGAGGIAAGQSYTVSFSGGQGTVTSNRGSMTDTVKPFQIGFTVVGEGGEQAPGPVVSSLPPISGTPTAFIEKIEGSGSIWISNESEEIPPSKRKWVKATSNMPLGPGYTIRTSTGASAIFRYRTGAVVKMNPKSWFGIQEPTVTKSSSSEMNGRLWQGISNFYFPKGAAAEKKWGVETNMAIVAIKGTSFVLEAGDAGTNLKVLEGSVEFTHKSTGKAATVEAGSSMTASSTGLGQKSTFNLSQEKAKWPDLSSYSSSNGNTGSSSTAASNQPSSPAKKKIKVGPFSCFIATAAYGSETAAELDTLRAFRDRVLMQSEAGRLFVDTYYEVSPPLAEFIAEHEDIRTFVRERMLDPIVSALNASRALWDH